MTQSTQEEQKCVRASEASARSRLITGTAQATAAGTVGAALAAIKPRGRWNRESVCKTHCALER